MITLPKKLKRKHLDLLNPLPVAYGGNDSYQYEKEVTIKDDGTTAEVLKLKKIDFDLDSRRFCSSNDFTLFQQISNGVLGSEVPSIQADSLSAAESFRSGFDNLKTLIENAKVVEQVRSAESSTSNINESHE